MRVWRKTEKALNPGSIDTCIPKGIQYLPHRRRRQIEPAAFAGAVAPSTEGSARVSSASRYRNTHDVIDHGGFFVHENDVPYTPVDSIFPSEVELPLEPVQPADRVVTNSELSRVAVLLDISRVEVIEEIIDLKTGTELEAPAP